MIMQIMQNIHSPTEISESVIQSYTLYSYTVYLYTMYIIDLIVHNYANYAKYTLSDRDFWESYTKLYTIQLYSIPVLNVYYRFNRA